MTTIAARACDPGLRKARRRRTCRSGVVQRGPALVGESGGTAGRLRVAAAHEGRIFRHPRVSFAVI